MYSRKYALTVRILGAGVGQRVDGLVDTVWEAANTTRLNVAANGPILRGRVRLLRPESKDVGPSFAHSSGFVSNET